jgi:hypothetical protein
MKDQNGQVKSTHEGIVEADISFFSNLFKEHVGCPIVVIIKVIDLSPRSITEDVNDSLLAQIIEEYFFSTLSDFQKRKNQGLDGL